MTLAAAAPRARPTPLGRRWVSGWGHVTLVVLNVVTASVAIGVVSLVIGGIAALPGALVGLLLLVPSLWLAQQLGRLERLRIEAFTGVVVGEPPAEQLTGWRRLVLSPQRWRATGFLGLHAIWGLLSGSVLTGTLAQAVVVVVLPVLTRLWPDALVREPGLRLWGMVQVGSGPYLAAVWVGAVLVLVAAPALARVLTQVDIHLATWLLGPDPNRELRALTDRVDTLTATRADTLDSVEAERRRIERDLHDGPQQRLVAIAMDLGMARQAMDQDPHAARHLLDQAHAASKDAIVEMRQVARGITPPILTDRGLDAALSALAARSPIPVEVQLVDVGRLDPTIEAIAYFCVSEALTNVAKHADAGAARVRMIIDGDRIEPALVLTVTDNGVGGADPSAGTGLTGLRQRVAAVDGTLAITSPVGGPTEIRVDLPLRPVRSAR